MKVLWAIAFVAGSVFAASPAGLDRFLVRHQDLLRLLKQTDPTMVPFEFESQLCQLVGEVRKDLDEGDPKTRNPDPFHVRVWARTDVVNSLMMQYPAGERASFSTRMSSRASADKAALMTILPAMRSPSMGLRRRYDALPAPLKLTIASVDAFQAKCSEPRSAEEKNFAPLLRAFHRELAQLNPQPELTIDPGVKPATHAAP